MQPARATHLTSWLRLFRPGDVLTLVLCAAFTAFVTLHFWSPDTPRQAIVRVGGQQVASLSLDTPRQFEVRGPLGVTRIEIEPGRARVASDPGPRQYCVKQGWLSRVGAIAICAPNEVSLMLEGRSGQFDSMSY
ncbi:NusG domain II-containing protein [Viridibacterium curvum]|uniref:NusG domain-containing protein n=1 Tax=Viridibacterium curvum TaxID=1101404 RepID=A0ABP9QMZ0_9RHOO